MAGRRVTVGNPSSRPQNRNRETSRRAATETGRKQKGGEGRPPSALWIHSAAPAARSSPRCHPFLIRTRATFHPSHPLHPEVGQPPRVPCGSPRMLDSTMEGRPAECPDQPAGQANRPNTSSGTPLTREPPPSAVNLTSAGRR